MNDNDNLTTLQETALAVLPVETQEPVEVITCEAFRDGSCFDDGATPERQEQLRAAWRKHRRECAECREKKKAERRENQRFHVVYETIEQLTDCHDMDKVIDAALALDKAFAELGLSVQETEIVGGPTWKPYTFFDPLCPPGCSPREVLERSIQFDPALGVLNLGVRCDGVRSAYDAEVEEIDNRVRDRILELPELAVLKETIAKMVEVDEQRMKLTESLSKSSAQKAELLEGASSAPLETAKKVSGLVAQEAATNAELGGFTDVLRRLDQTRADQEKDYDAACRALWSLEMQKVQDDSVNAARTHDGLLSSPHVQATLTRLAVKRQLAFDLMRAGQRDQARYHLMRLSPPLPSVPSIRSEVVLRDNSTQLAGLPELGPAVVFTPPPPQGMDTHPVKVDGRPV